MSDKKLRRLGREINKLDFSFFTVEHIEDNLLRMFITTNRGQIVAYIQQLDQYEEYDLLFKLGKPIKSIHNQYERLSMQEHRLMYRNALNFITRLLRFYEPIGINQDIDVIICGDEVDRIIEKIQYHIDETNKMLYMLKKKLGTK